MTRPTDNSGRGGDRRRHPQGGTSGPTRTLGLTPPVAGAVSYLLTFVTGIVFYLVADDRFVRFHAAQSILLFGLLAGLNVSLSVAVGLAAAVPGIPVRLLGAVSALLGPVGLVAWVVLMYLAFRGDEYAVPIVGGLARRLV